MKDVTAHSALSVSGHYEADKPVGEVEMVQITAQMQKQKTFFSQLICKTAQYSVPLTRLSTTLLFPHMKRICFWI